MVDDDAITIMICEKILSHVSFAEQIISATNGSEAINFIVKCFNDNTPLPQLIFLDLNMPIMNGWEFLEAFKDLNFPQNNQPIVCILSSTIDAEDANRAMQYSFVKKFISKPLTKEILDTITLNFT